MVQATIHPIPNRAEEQQLLHCLAAGETCAFWQLFQQYRDYLFRCCIKWTNGNLTEAEDLLSQAMLKALEKAQKYAGKIENFKSWLITLTRNFWIDLKRRSCAKQVENIEVYGEREDIGWVGVNDTPGSTLERDDKNRVIRAAIDELPTKMRETFILHFYEELSYQETVERQGISYQNVCKRISQARTILAKKLRGYFIKEEKASIEESVTPVAIEPVIEETPLEDVGVEQSVDVWVTLSVVVEEVETVVAEESAEVVVSEQQSELDFVVVTAEGRLEVRSDGCRCVEAALSERQSAPILALVQFEQETGGSENSYLAVQRRQKQYQVGKIAEFVRSSRAPPCYCFAYFQFLVKTLWGIQFWKKSFKSKNSEIDFFNRLEV